MDGDMIRFEYHGKTAYVAEYCCKLLKQEPAKKTEPAQREAVIEVKKSESDRASYNTGNSSTASNNSK